MTEWRHRSLVTRRDRSNSREKSPFFADGPARDISNDYRCRQQQYDMALQYGSARGRMQVANLRKRGFRRRGMINHNSSRRGHQQALWSRPRYSMTHEAPHLGSSDLRWRLHDQRHEQSLGGDNSPTGYLRRSHLPEWRRRQASSRSCERTSLPRRCSDDRSCQLNSGYKDVDKHDDAGYPEYQRYWDSVIKTMLNRSDKNVNSREESALSDISNEESEEWWCRPLPKLKSKVIRTDRENSSRTLTPDRGRANMDHRTDRENSSSRTLSPDRGLANMDHRSDRENSSCHTRTPDRRRANMDDSPQPSGHDADGHCQTGPSSTERRRRRADQRSEGRPSVSGGPPIDRVSETESRSYNPCNDGNSSSTSSSSSSSSSSSCDSKCTCDSGEEVPNTSSSSNNRTLETSLSTSQVTSSEDSGNASLLEASFQRTDPRAFALDQLRRLTRWVLSSSIQRYMPAVRPPQLAAMQMGVQRDTDVNKWVECGVQHVVMVERAGPHMDSARTAHREAWHAGHCFSVDWVCRDYTREVWPHIPVDVACSHLTLHTAFAAAAQAELFAHNLSCSLKEGACAVVTSISAARVLALARKSQDGRTYKGPNFRLKIGRSARSSLPQFGVKLTMQIGPDKFNDYLAQLGVIEEVLGSHHLQVQVRRSFLQLFDETCNFSSCLQQLELLQLVSANCPGRDRLSLAMQDIAQLFDVIIFRKTSCAV